MNVVQVFYVKLQQLCIYSRWTTHIQALYELAVTKGEFPQNLEVTKLGRQKKVGVHERRQL